MPLCHAKTCAAVYHCCDCCGAGSSHPSEFLWTLRRLVMAIDDATTRAAIHRHIDVWAAPLTRPERDLLRLLLAPDETDPRVARAG